MYWKRRTYGSFSPNSSLIKKHTWVSVKVAEVGNMIFHTSHLSQTFVHIQTVFFFSQNGPPEVCNISSGCKEQWVNQETYRLLTREAQLARSCNPLSADDIKPIIPMQARWITDFLSSAVSGYQDLFESACFGWRESYSWKVFRSGV